MSMWSYTKPKPWEADLKRRGEGIAKVCKILHTSKAMLCDPFLYLITPSIDIERLEKWLIKHGKYHREDDVSLRDVIKKHYGKDTADLIESLF